METEPRLLTEAGVPDTPRPGQKGYLPEVGIAGTIMLLTVFLFLRFLERTRGFRAQNAELSGNGGDQARPRNWSAQDAMLNRLNENVVALSQAVRDLATNVHDLTAETRDLGKYLRERAG